MELLNLREQISEIDRKVLEQLEERMRISKDISKVKKETNLPIEDKKREEELILNRQSYTSINKEFVEDLFKLIIKESKRIQNDN